MKRRNVLGSLLAGLALSPALAASKKKTKKTSAKPFIRTADGADLYFQDWGQGKTILFVAPWALNSNWWEYQVPYLCSHGFRCISYDRRGHGRSDSPSTGYEFDTLGRDLAELISQLDLRDITLVGHSMGCAEVARYLSAYGAERVTRTMLIATITPFIMKSSDNPGFDRSILEGARLKLMKDRPQQIADAAATFFGSPKNAISAGVVEWWIRMMVEQCSMQVMLELHRAMTETDFRSDLKKIKIPTLLIHGDSDQSANIDFTSRRTLPLISGAKLKVYEGAAHGLPVTHMDKLNAELMEFVQGT